jgi:UDP-N-acetylmuramoyl-L-alanyl-D-glutamate--2,6-diaminopimelate ligase
MTDGRNIASETGRTGPALTLSKIISVVGAARWLNFREITVRDVTDDSRRAGPHTLFVAVPGETADGHRFIQDALDRGACAVVCQEAPDPAPSCPIIQVADSRAALSALAAALHGCPARRLHVVGVTGTDGKTTTTELCAAILNEAGRRAGSLGTVRYNLGGRSIDSSQTTPHPLMLHAMLREMADAGLTHVCMEVSSHSLMQKRTADVPFEAACLTNVTEDHLDYHKTHEAYVAAKGLLFESLAPGAAAVLNAASPACELYRSLCRARVLTYGMDQAGLRADVRGVKRSEGLGGMDLTVRRAEGVLELHTPMAGAYNCENILAAATAAFALGVGEDAVRRAVAAFRGVPGRLERIECPTGAVFVDYAHTPNGLRSVLSALRPLARGRLICVFGCGGDREVQKRPLMGAVSAGLADVTIVTSDNSRSERTENIIAQIVAGIPANGKPLYTEPDRRRAIAMGLDELRSPQDVLAICGRGCEQVQIIGPSRTPFDDRVVTTELVQERARQRRRSA